LYILILILANLFAKVPQLGEGEETFSVFESSCQILTTFSKLFELWTLIC